ncbi:hypothetical protein KM043_010430 [Ampulex compressa]|nr:hypothetical protein KM043_010430 [Ampulex compressa]
MNMKRLYDIIYEDTCLKRRCSDRVSYEKKRKAEQCFQQQVRWYAQLSQEQEEREATRLEWSIQRLAARCQWYAIKRNAARAVFSTYKAMLDILKKDAMYFEIPLSSLGRDRGEQCKIMLRATVMGQIATEDLDDIGEKYRRMARIVWNNMKEREKELNHVGGQVQDLWTYARSLVRVESDAYLRKEEDPSTNLNKSVERDVRRLEDTFEKMKEALRVRSYQDFLSRLEEQRGRKARLLARLHHNEKEYRSLLEEKDRATSCLSDAKHAVINAEGQFTTDEKVMLERIQAEKKRETENNYLIRDRGLVLMNVRAALRNMVAMMGSVRKAGKGAKRATKGTEERITREEQEECEIKLESAILEEIETDGLALLSKLTRKLGALFGMSNFELDPEKEKRARDLYGAYVSDCRSKWAFDGTAAAAAAAAAVAVESERTGLHLEHQVVDSSVPTRTAIKLRSKRTVNAHLKYE